jgi:hypothetical protein
MSQRLRSVPGRTKTKAFAVIARNAGEADTVRFHFRPCLRTHEPPQRRDHRGSRGSSRITIVRPTAASSLPILIFFVFFALEASVSPEGASDAIGTQPRYLLDAMRSAKRAIEVPLNTTYRLTIFIPFIRA